VFKPPSTGRNVVNDESVFLVGVLPVDFGAHIYDLPEVGFDFFPVVVCLSNHGHVVWDAIVIESKQVVIPDDNRAVSQLVVIFRYPGPLVRSIGRQSGGNLIPLEFWKKVHHDGVVFRVLGVHEHGGSIDIGLIGVDEACSYSKFERIYLVTDGHVSGGVIVNAPNILPDFLETWRFSIGSFDLESLYISGIFPYHIGARDPNGHLYIERIQRHVLQVHVDLRIVAGRVWEPDVEDHLGIDVRQGARKQEYGEQCSVVNVHVDGLKMFKSKKVIASGRPGKAMFFNKQPACAKVLEKWSIF
jgi:hypothetical protein